jgi:Raf kinase inhibitor-like YbhB/YbcL family protein
VNPHFRVPILLLSVSPLIGSLAALSPGDAASRSAPQKEPAMSIDITSPAFAEGSPIPRKHTCDAEDVSPPLKWANLPEGTVSLALICDDPDAPVGNWVHWVLYGLPASVTELSEGVPPKPSLPNGARQGQNDFRRIGYGGPCPPAGSPHRYFFNLYALDTEIDLPPEATKKQLLKAMEGHVLADGHLMGTYQRSR